MENEEIKEMLKSILGSAAYNNSMIVPKDISKLVKSIDYLSVQLQIIKKDCKDDDQKRYIDEVIRNLIGILKK